MSNLNESQLQALKVRLEEREHQLRTVIREEAALSAEQQFEDLAGPVGDAADQSVADMLTDLGNAVIGRQLTELREIQAAYERMAKGIYGVCIDCGEDIGYPRLTAFPTAKRCMTCQRQRERTYAE